MAADSYNVLAGDDFLCMAQADSSDTLRLKMGLE